MTPLFHDPIVPLFASIRPVDEIFYTIFEGIPCLLIAILISSCNCSFMFLLVLSSLMQYHVNINANNQKRLKDLYESDKMRKIAIAMKNTVMQPHAVFELD